jgi:hypothetical protein
VEYNRDYFNNLKNKTKALANSIDEVDCFILKTKVKFNSIGFRHLIYKPDGTARKIQEAVYKLRLFPLAVMVIKNATTVTEERNFLIRLSRKKNSPKKNAKTFALVAKVGRRNPIDVRVVILKVGNGKCLFYSIMKN